jgi:hypothetical protein
VPTSHTGAIATVDPATSLSDENTPDPPRRRRRAKKTPVPETREDGSSSPARGHFAEESGSELERATAHGAGTDSATGSPPAAVLKTAEPEAPARIAPESRAETLPEPVRPPEPVWPVEPVARNLPTKLEPLGELERKPIPDWERTSAAAAWSEARWEHASEPAPPSRPLPSADDQHRRGRRSRAVTTTIVLVSLFIVFAAVAAVVASLHHSAPPSHGRASAPRPKVSSADVTRVRTATAAADAATTTVHVNLDSLHGIPTPAGVAAVINPYVQSLQQFQSVLATTALPARTRTAAASAQVLVTQDVQFLATINGLPSIRLGSYLEQVGQESADLQSTLARLQTELPASHG